MDYYSLPFCRPDKILKVNENLGEVLRGDRIENSPYQVRRGCCLKMHRAERASAVARTGTDACSGDIITLLVQS